MTATIELDRTAVPDYRRDSVGAGSSALVLGAGQGIGRQSAHALAQHGYHVICVDTVEERAEHVSDETGGTALVADAITVDGTRALAEAIGASASPVTAIVDIIGMAYFDDLSDVTDEDWARQFELVFEHARRVIRDLTPLISAPATVTFVSSAVAFTGGQHFGAYAAAKAALTSLVKTAAVELAERNIRVNAVAPGVVSTPRMTALLGQERASAFAMNTPLGRLVAPDDIASAIAFLAGSPTGSITGQSLIIDGGVSARFPYPDFVDARRSP